MRYAINQSERTAGLFPRRQWVESYNVLCTVGCFVRNEAGVLRSLSMDYELCFTIFNTNLSYIFLVKIVIYLALTLINYYENSSIYSYL